MKVSVIVPIYNVERYIARCVKSLMEQTLQEVEYIFVDDCATDKSMDILKRTLNEYPNRKSNVRILKHKENQGLPAARNTGLKSATGKYIFHCDSDDYVESDMLKRLFEFAEEQHADYIWSDYYVSLIDGSYYKKQPGYVDVDQAFRGLLCGEMVYNVWNKLVRKDLYNNIFFPSGNAMGEDMTMIMLLACANKVAYLHYGGYYYVTTNPGALTKKICNEKSLKELLYNIKRTSDFVSEKFGNRYSYELSCFKLNIKWSILAFNNDIKSYKLWHDSFPEANVYIFKQNVSIRIKLVEWCASKGLYWLVKLHYLLVIKFFYTITGK
ncbi:glycosyltransferase family 2 protein [Phocaeicola plebeius]|jgi:glycosyltransferase involved in cell wall biosynthesis|uniref:glycosyltransferase family 2 protein n=1 Tax=Phocaeicola plebeius TaxID=310297 RepID=UPI0022E1DA97|nr:glycosyltransferase family 2 protein [Phocaeicola plebeius]